MSGPRTWKIGPTFSSLQACGVCGADVILVEGAGTVALTVVDRHGMKVPHVCPEADVGRWLAHNATIRQCAAIARSSAVRAKAEANGDGS